MITFEGWRVPEDFINDGCTLSPDKPFGVNLSPACRLHDFIRTYALVTVQEADKIFKRYVKELGAPHWLATIYWLGVKVARPWFRKTQVLPDVWKRQGFNKPITKSTV